MSGTFFRIALGCGASVLALSAANAQQVASANQSAGTDATQASDQPAAPAQAGSNSNPADVVVITGIRQSLRTNAQIKKNTLEVVDSITAEDIGKLPDSNVAETLTRIPGVQGYRYGGEGASPVGTGSGLTIRGLSGQTASRIDGRAYFTAGQREFNIEGANPGMVAGIDVFKNPSAEHIEGGIGGLVNIRTRHPLDLKGLTIAGAVTGRYNDMVKKAQPEVFGLIADKWNVGDGGEIGILIAADYQKSWNRSDNNPANGGTNFRRAIRADSTEYLTAIRRDASGNPILDAQGNTQRLYDSSYDGRTDVSYLADVNPLTLTAAQRANLITTVTEAANVFEEDIHRVRKGLNGVFQWKPSPDLEFYAEGNYNYYLYNQDYRFLTTGDSRYVRNLVTTPYNFTEGLANRNSNGGADESLAGQALSSGTFLKSSVGSIGGNEHRPYTTWIAATGFKWRAAPNFDVHLDLSYVKADQSQDNRSVTLAPAAGATWNITRDLTTTPHQMDITGPDLASTANWVFANYANGTNQTWNDKGGAAQLDFIYRPDIAFLKTLKAGVRYGVQTDSYHNYSYNKNLTTDGKAVAANGSNATPIGAYADLFETSHTNFMEGDAGYSGGYLVFSPDALLGNNVPERLTFVTLPSQDALPENLLLRRYAKEQTYAGYVMGEFGFLDDRIRGNAGVRVVKTDLLSRGMQNDTSGTTPVIVPTEATRSYTNVLPSLNVTGYITRNTLLRFGYGKGITRPDMGALNPAVVVNPNTGQASVGNPNLKPQKADSYDVSLEHYFGAANYVSVDGFYKKIDGFFSGVDQCVTVTTSTPYTGQTSNSCPAGQFRLTQTVNALQGSAKGVEATLQTFFDFDFVPRVFHNFGVAASYTYVKTKNPLLINGMTVITPQPFTSKNSWSVAGLYENKLLSARVVYTYRSDFVLFGISNNPVDGRYVKGYGILDASVNFNLPHNFGLSLTASNILNQGSNRYVGEPGAYATGFERQHYMNGRIFGASLRYKLGS
jgi:TonB-dependent receptor